MRRSAAPSASTGTAATGSWTAFLRASHHRQETAMFDASSVESAPLPLAPSTSTFSSGSAATSGVDYGVASGVISGVPSGRGSSAVAPYAETRLPTVHG